MLFPPWIVAASYQGIPRRARVMNKPVPLRDISLVGGPPSVVQKQSRAMRERMAAEDTSDDPSRLHQAIEPS